ncbi:unnamed protein product, partial [Ascophyllum nodosum]
KQRRTVGVAAAEGQDQDYQDPDLEPVADGNDGVDSAGDSVTSVSVGSGSGSVSADSRGEDNGVTSCQVAATDTAPGAGDLKGVTGTGNRGAILEEAPQGSGRASSGGGTARNVSVRKLSREIEELKLTCAELERSRLDTERQTLAYASGFIQDRAVALMATLRVSGTLQANETLFLPLMRQSAAAAAARAPIASAKWTIGTNSTADALVKGRRGRPVTGC